MKENLELLMKKLNKAYLIYKNEFLNKNFLVIARKGKNIEIIEIKFRKEHFKHLVGIRGIKANDFFEKLSQKRLSIKELQELEKNPYIIEKLNSFSKLKKLLEESPYLYDFHPHSTPKVELDKIIADIDKERANRIEVFKKFIRKILCTSFYRKKKSIRNNNGR